MESRLVRLYLAVMAVAKGLGGGIEQVEGNRQDIRGRRKTLKIKVHVPGTTTPAHVRQVACYFALAFGSFNNEKLMDYQSQDEAGNFVWKIEIDNADATEKLQLLNAMSVASESYVSLHGYEIRFTGEVPNLHFQSGHLDVLATLTFLTQCLPETWVKTEEPLKLCFMFRMQLA